MSFAISHFSNPLPIRDAIKLAEENPEDVSASADYEISQNPITEEYEMHANIFAIGRNSRFTWEDYGPIRTIHCQTFISLGKIEHKALKVFADHVVLVNEVCSQGFIEFYAKKTFVAVGCMVKSPDIKVFSNDPWIHHPTINHFVKWEDKVITQSEYEGKTRKVVSLKIAEEWHEDPIDASLRDIRKELDLQEFFDLHEYTKEVAQKMRLTSILI